MKKLVRNLLLLICCLVFIFSLYKVGSYYFGTIQSNKLNKELSSLIEDDKGRVLSFSQKYHDLLNRNSDMIGWIKIDDTQLNYPVMQTIDDEEFYLRRNFDKEYEFRGTLFVNANANLNRDMNIIIYGHNMDDGTMFGTLRKYSNYDFYKNHKYIEFETSYENSIYEIAYVFKTVDILDHPLYIDYYHFYNAESEIDFKHQMNLYKNASFYNTNVNIDYQDQLLTLSTCEYSNDNGRLVIVAKKIEK